MWIYQSTRLMTMTVMEMPKKSLRNQVHLRVHPRLQDQAPDHDQDLDLGPDQDPGRVLVGDLRRAIQDLGPGNRVNR